MKVYTSRREPERGEPRRRRVGIADFAVGRDDTTLVTSGLGSCVGIAVFDAEEAVAGLAHVMLPRAPDDGDHAKYADTAVPALVRSVEEAGARRGALRAKLAGGATMFEFTSADGSIGDRNVAASRDALRSLDVPVVAEDVGGDFGRSLEFSALTGALRVRSANAGERVL
jgi:chemotaxis protein CheD